MTFLLHYPNQKLLKLIKTKNPKQLFRVFMWYLQESNQGHTDFQSVALPTELRYLANAGANIKPYLNMDNIFLRKKRKRIKAIKLYPFYHFIIKEIKNAQNFFLLKIVCSL